ncbi:MAG TPA: TetR/AcrR family transcriptional regulator [Actinotalea sp.]|jgi:AcrR family transcriptional regulator
MPRAFTADEVTRIRERILVAAADSFASRGLRGTTVESLARAAGISKGGFYAFFESKETVFLALLEQYELRTHAAVEAAVRSDPARGLDVLLTATLRAAEDYPFLAVVMSDEALAVMRGLSPEQQDELLRRDERMVARVFAAMDEAGLRPAVSEAVLLGLLRSLFFVGWHRRDVGTELADEVTAWLAPVLRSALVGPGTT